MKDARPSRTAHLVALGRALASAGLSHVQGFSDPTASAFLNQKGERSLEAAVKRSREGQRGFRLEMAKVMADLIALRTVAIDAAVRDAIAAGANQLVILGAGYDGRAWRMPELNNVRVFEVDHPATQGDKKIRQARLNPPQGDVTFVAMNFEKESLAEVLERSGHDRSAPTCWIWEGVVMYLTREAMCATLADVASRSARGATLIVNYHMAHRKFFARLMFRLIGEPQISAWTPAEMEADLNSVGFKVREDSGMADWNRRFVNGKARVERGWYMRIAVAQK